MNLFGDGVFTAQTISPPASASVPLYLGLPLPLFSPFLKQGLRSYSSGLPGQTKLDDDPPP